MRAGVTAVTADDQDRESGPVWGVGGLYQLVDSGIPRRSRTGSGSRPSPARGTPPACARPRRCTSCAAPPRSGRSGPPRRDAADRGTSGTWRCPPRTGLARPVERGVLGGAQPDGPRRRHPEALLVEPPVGGALQVARRLVGRRTRTRPSRSAAAARGPRRGVPDAAVRPTCRPGASAAHSSTAENCGRPTPVIIRVVHIAPGPTPTLTMSAPASIRSRVPSAVTTLPATTGTAGSRPRTAASALIILSWWPCAVSTTRRSAPASSSALAFPATSPLTPTAAAMRSRPVASTAGW